MDKETQEYLKSLNDLEKKAQQIAQEHLETSYSIKKSIGFLKWKENK